MLTFKNHKVTVEKTSAMFKLFGRCQSCDELQKQNEYLRKLCDNLLSARGINPVTPAPALDDDTDDDKADRALRESGAIIMGG